MRILVAGLTAETTSALARRLSTLDVLDCPTWRAATILRQAGPFDLLVLGADGLGQDGLDMMHKVRDLYDAETLPMIFVVPPTMDRETVEREAREVRVNSLLLPPVSPEQVIRQVAVLLKLLVSLLDEVPDTVISSSADAAWHRLQVVLARRLDLLERCAKARDGGNTTTLLARNGASEANKLSDQLRAMGNERAARLAADVAELFVSKGQSGDSAIVHIDRLRRLLTEAAEETVEASGVVPLPSVLFCDADRPEVEELVRLGRSRGMMVGAAYDLGTAVQRVEEHRPDVVVLDPAMTPSWDNMVAFFGRLQGIPILVHTRQSDQEARLAASRLGAAAFLPKPAPPDDLIERVEHLLSRLERSKPRVLAVDDDELSLAAVQAILEEHDIVCVTLQDPRQFWQTFEDVVPDLVVLDLQMPHVNGLELCRMLRNDPAWKTQPVLILTAATDPEVVASVYGAGADDYASKPITAEELVGRILNRLERQRLLQLGPDLEPTTGLLWRRRFAHTLSYLFRCSPTLSLAVVGLDCFQDVNAATDFDSGDTMLRWMAGLLQRALPQALLGRWCSDQFVLALPSVDLDSACQQLEGALAQVRAEVFGEVAGRLLHLSFSVGVAQYQRDGLTLEALYLAAARAMAQAKRNGRGTVVASSWFETPTYVQEPPEVILVHSDAELCRRLRQALHARGRHVEIVPDCRNAVTNLVMTATQRPGTVVVLEVTARNPDTWALLRMFSKTRAAEQTRLLVLLDQTSKESADDAFSLGAWFVLSADAQFPQLVQRIREALD